ncbi:DC-STAMP domain-containing protein 2 [Octopus bimaculoides]|uniref:Uncharacterized protein n=1 Tax=Octopus bimaculoides TaxID=37653 RepID=A0A0L8IFA2_OCTBM|nr:DC-STAMP domain-containing protein 2 [Octopus bimaculoides]|eukprot:XP_014773461.1 PREDICTED: DC-STAMP domain-containing protein 2-like [Octopus bimaculoides]
MMFVQKTLKAIQLKISLRRLAKAKRRAVKLHEECCIRKKEDLKPGSYYQQFCSLSLWFLFGSMVNLFLYLVLIYHVETTLWTAIIICFFAGFVLCLVLPYSVAVRCTILLAAPGFFTSKGRSFLILYAFMLTLNQPVANFSNNIVVMTEAMTCGQEVAYNQTERLIAIALNPLSGIIGGIEDFVNTINRYSRMAQQAFLSMKKGIEELIASINNIFSWLGNIVNVCNERMLDPFRKCTRAFRLARINCVRTVLPEFVKLCNIVTFFKSICHLARIGEMLCSLTEVLKKLVLRTFAAPVSKAIQNLYDMFYFKIKIDYEYQVSMEQTKSYSQVKRDVLREVKEKLSMYFTKLEFIKFVTDLMLIIVFVKAYRYRIKYLSKDKFDNIYLSKNLYDIDYIKGMQSKETLLPLKRSEKQNYISSTSLRLTCQEKRKFCKGFVFFLITSSTILFHLFCDYGLFWILELVRKSFSMKVDVEELSHVQVHVSGNGPYADMYKSLISIFGPLATNDVKNLTLCLPNPTEPNYEVYKTIGMIMGLCLISVVFEGYGRRLRHIVCDEFYPVRAKERAVWLYSNLLVQRGSLEKFLRRKMRLDYRSSMDAKNISWKGKLAARCPPVRRLLEILGFEIKYCLGCSADGKISDRVNFKHCENESCKAVYCLDCYYDIHNTCTVCMKPIDYADLSDVSDERDSSECDAENFYQSDQNKKKLQAKVAMEQENIARNNRLQRRKSQTLLQKAYDLIRMEYKPLKERTRCNYRYR